MYFSIKQAEQPSFPRLPPEQRGSSLQSISGQVRAASNQDFWAVFLFLLLIIWKRKSFAQGKLQNCHFKCFVLFSKHIRGRTKGREGEPKKSFQVKKKGQQGRQNFGGRFLWHPVRPVSRQNWGERAKTLNSINAILAAEWMWQWETVGSSLTQMENLQVKNYNNRLP